MPPIFYATPRLFAVYAACRCFSAGYYMPAIDIDAATPPCHMLLMPAAIFADAVMPLMRYGAKSYEDPHA